MAGVVVGWLALGEGDRRGARVDGGVERGVLAGTSAVAVTGVVWRGAAGAASGVSLDGADVSTATARA
jgi:hypothetical protein